MLERIVPHAESSARRELDRLVRGEDLSEEQAAELLLALTEPSMPAAVAGALLVALRVKGETPEEIRGFASAMRRLARRPEIDGTNGAVDVVGTGGDGSGSLNLSTGSALLTAACGQPVVKHGNRSVSSRSGSADVLEALGLDLPLDERSAGRCLSRTGFTFLFAPYFHPAMKSLASLRRELGVRTVFNVLGPLTNPAQPPYGVIGAYDVGTAARMAQGFSGLPVERVFVVHGSPGWDEATPVGPFLLFDVRPGRVVRVERDPAACGLARCRPEELAGGDAAENARRLRAAFEGETGAHRDALVLGAALALEVTGSAPSPGAAVARAAEAIDGGAALRLVERLADFSRSLRGGADG